MNIAIITACPSGVANSILAAGLLEQAAAKLGWNAKIECQSSVITPTLLTDADIEQADAIVIAANTTVDTSRFVGKKVYQAEISAVAKDATAFLRPQSKVQQHLNKQPQLKRLSKVLLQPRKSSLLRHALLALRIPSWQQKR